MSLCYQHNKASQTEILRHLQCVSTAFVQDLSQRVNLEEYSQKLFSLAEREEAWFEDELIGLVAYYINQDAQKSFITNVSVDVKYQNQGVATELLGKAVEFSAGKSIKMVSLEVADDEKLLRFYTKQGFCYRNNEDANELIMYLTPLVVIRCTVFNHEPYLRDCLDGFVMQQTNFPFVAVVHDDASTDNSAAIIREYAEKYPNIIRPIFEIENQFSKGDGSLTRIMKAAVDTTDAKYVAMCEGDDYWTDPLKLQKQVDILEANPNYSMCYTDYTNVNDSSVSIVWPNRKFNINRSYSGDIFAELLKGNYIQTCTILYRKSITDDKEYQGRLDYELSLQCALNGKCFFIKTKTASYRLQPNSAIHTLNEQLQCITIDIWRRYVDRYVNRCEYRRTLFSHVHIMSIISARMISMARSKNKTEKEIFDTILKANPILYIYVPFGLILRTYNVIRKYFKR